MKKRHVYVKDAEFGDIYDEPWRTVMAPGEPIEVVVARAVSARYTAGALHGLRMKVVGGEGTKLKPYLVSLRSSAQAPNWRLVTDVLGRPKIMKATVYYRVRLDGDGLDKFDDLVWVAKKKVIKAHLRGTGSAREAVERSLGRHIGKRLLKSLKIEFIEGDGSSTRPHVVAVHGEKEPGGE